MIRTVYLRQAQHRPYQSIVVKDGENLLCIIDWDDRLTGEQNHLKAFLNAVELGKITDITDMSDMVYIFPYQDASECIYFSKSAPRPVLEKKEASDGHANAE